MPRPSASPQEGCPSCSFVSDHFEGALPHLAARDVTIIIDETTPLGRSEIKGTDPITIAVESGAFENPKVLRTLLADNVANVTGRLLLRIRDRESGAFDDAPADSALRNSFSIALRSSSVATWSKARSPMT